MKKIFVMFLSLCLLFANVSYAQNISLGNTNQNNPKESSINSQRSRVAHDEVRIFMDEKNEEKTRIIARAIGIPTVRARWIGKRLVIDGEVGDAEEINRAMAIARLYEPGAQSALRIRKRKGSIGEGPMIELAFYAVAIKKSAVKSLGITWAPGSMPQNVANGFAGFASSILGFVFNLLPKFRYLNEKGLLHVAENPSFVVKSGETADIFVGDEMPYHDQGNVRFQRMGLEVEAIPVEVKGKIDVSMKIKVSSPSAHMRGAVQVNSFSTTVLCPAGQSIVLAKIDRSQRTYLKNKYPDGTDMSSALFSFSKGSDSQSSDTEWLVFMTPKFVNSGMNVAHNIDRWKSWSDEILEPANSLFDKEKIQKKAQKKHSKQSKRRRGWEKR